MKRALLETLADARHEIGRASSLVGKSRAAARAIIAIARVCLTSSGPLIPAGGWIDPWRADVTFAWRRLLRAPGFSAVAIVTLALGIGANTAFFSLVNSLLFKPLQLHDYDRLAVVAPGAADARFPRASLTQDDFAIVQHTVFQSVESFAMSDPLQMAMSADGQAGLLFGEAVAGSYFETFGVRALVGRTLHATDDDPAEPPAIVISERLWRQWFGGDPTAIGRVIKVSQTPVTLAGVVPDAFVGTWLPNAVRSEFWMPLRLVPPPPRTVVVLGPASVRAHRVFARLRSAEDWARATSELSAIGSRLPSSARRGGLTLLPARRAIVPDEFDRTGSAIASAVLALSGLVLLIACANLANLFLARATARAGEMAIRLATGASRGRIVQMLLVEASLVSGLGGAAGLALALGLSRYLATIPLPELDGMHIAYDASPDFRVFAYAFAIAFVAAIAVGVMPALRAANTDPIAVLAASGAGGATRSGRTFRTLLVASQMAASVVLLLAAGLFVRSMLYGWSYDPGFRTDGIAIGYVGLDRNGFDEARGRSFYRRLADAASHMPGIQEAVIASGVPSTHGPSVGVDVFVEGEPTDPQGRAPYAGYVTTTPGLFRLLNIRLLEGRDFTADDLSSTRLVAIVNQSAAARFWPRQTAIGKRFRLGPKHPLLEVVGVVGDTDRFESNPALWRFVYVPLDQHYGSKMALIARGQGDDPTIPESLRQAVRTADPEVAAYDVRTLAEHTTIWLMPVRAGAVALSVLGLLGLGLAVLGLYGVTTYVVGQRSREFGIRKSLGAEPRALYRLVLSQAIRMLLVGALPGVVLAFSLSGLLEHVLFGITPHDAITFAAVPLLLIVVGAIASIGPARRAARVNPIVALRDL